VIRYGGEEFLMLLPRTTIEGAVQVAERLRIQVEEHRFSVHENELSISISAGVSQHESSEDIESFLARADAALYDAKKSGRNRICAALDAGDF
jgi:diguanylate cyclase (GGDEF)-like protein